MLDWIGGILARTENRRLELWTRNGSRSCTSKASRRLVCLLLHSLFRSVFRLGMAAAAVQKTCIFRALSRGHGQDRVDVVCKGPTQRVTAFLFRRLRPWGTRGFVVREGERFVPPTWNTCADCLARRWDDLKRLVCSGISFWGLV